MQWCWVPGGAVGSMRTVYVGFVPMGGDAWQGKRQALSDQC